MTNIFLKIIDMSVSASVIALVVLILRLFLKKSPKRLTVLLWAVVALRLILPFSIESVFSLMPGKNENALTFVPESFEMSQESVIAPIDPPINENLIPITPTVPVQTPTQTVQEETFDILPVLSYIWIAGVLLLTVYMAVSSMLVYKKIKSASLVKDNIYTSDNISSPFVFGFVIPKIYIPSTLEESHFEHIVSHENAHIRRLDHIIKPLGFLVLSLHWFNPLMWLSYILFCRDIEFACDENVVKKMTSTERADYSQALLDCSINSRVLSVYPTAFGEVGVKSRIKSVLSYKKPTVWIIIIALLALLITAVCFLTDPEKEVETPKNDEPVLEEEFEKIPENVLKIPDGKESPEYVVGFATEKGIPENVVRIANEIGDSLIDHNQGVSSSTILSLGKILTQKDVSNTESVITLYKMVYWISPTIATPGHTDNFITHTIYFAVAENSGNYTNLGWIFEKELEERYDDTTAFMNELTGNYNDYLNKNSQEIVICKDKDYSVTLRNVNDILEASPKKQISEFISALCLGDKEIVDIYIGGSIENFDSIKMDAYATVTDNYTTALVYLDVQKSESPAFPEGQYQYLLKLNESPYLSVVDFFGKMEKYALCSSPMTVYYASYQSDPLIVDALSFTYNDLIRLGDYSENIENHAFHIMQHSLPNAEDGYSDYETIEKYFFDRFGIEVKNNYSIKRELDGKKTVIDGEEKYMVGCAHGANASANRFEKIEQNGNKYSISFIFHSDFAYISESERRIFTFEKVEGSDILRFIKFESEKLSNEKTAGYAF